MENKGKELNQSRKIVNLNTTKQANEKNFPNNNRSPFTEDSIKL